MTERQIENTIEWEGLRKPTVFSVGVAFPCPPFMSGVEQLTVSRDESYGLRLIAEGTWSDNGAESRARRAAERSIPLGSFLENQGISLDGPLKATIVGFIDPVPSDVALRGPRERPRFSQHGYATRYREYQTTRLDVSGGYGAPKIVPLGAAAWRSEWFINGRQSFICRRRTSRKREATFERMRAIGGIATRELPTGNDARDHALVEAAGIRFALSKVPGGHAPEWTSPYSIDYAAPAPDEEIREAVAEIVSFIVGRRLMPIGYTTFDDSGWSIDCEAWNPWGQDIRRLCAQLDEPPIALDVRDGDVEDIVGKLLPRYLELREPLRLRDALHAYWLADEAHTGVDLTVYSSALEALKNQWVKSRSISVGVYMPEREFMEKLREHLEALKQRLRELDWPEAIANKICSAWRRGGNEQLYAFLEELSLRVGTAERKSIKERNTPAHGGLKVAANFRELSRYATAYRVLFVRAFLKVLGHSGSYVDRTTLGHPSRHVDEPAGGEV